MTLGGFCKRCSFHQKIALRNKLERFFFSSVFCRLSWEEESNVSTGDDNSPAGTKTLTRFNLIRLRVVLRAFSFSTVQV